MALGRLEGGATTGGIKLSAFLLKRGMFGGGKMMVHFMLPSVEQLELVSSDVTSCDVVAPPRRNFKLVLLLQYKLNHDVLG